MKKLKSFLHNNKGSGIVTVIVAVSFLTILASLLLVSSYTAYSIKAADKAGKENYYDAASVLEEVRASLQNVVSDGISKAYAATMPDYSLSGTGVEARFKKTYQDAVISYKADASMAKDPNGNLQLFTLVAGQSYYEINPNIIGSLVTDKRSERATVQLTCDRVVKNTDYSVGLENLKIVYNDGQRTSTITCDISLSCPDITKVLTNYAIKGLPDYTVVADKALNIAAGNPVTLLGNSYMGKLDVPVGAALTVAEGNMVCKSDANITLSAAKDSSASLTVNEGASLWATSVIVENNRKISLLGDTFLANDLMLNGDNAEATLGGKFFGYGYDDTDSYRSSSIIANGLNTKLELAGITNLDMAGIAFIGDSTTFNAMESAYVPMGESIATRANEDAYMAPAECLSIVGAGSVESNPIVKSEPMEQGTVIMNIKATPPNLTKTYEQYGVQEEVRVVNISGTNGQKVIYFFLDFESDTKRSEYFRDYFSANRTKVSEYISVTKAANTMFKTKGGYLVTADGYTVCDPDAGSERIAQNTCDSYNRQFASLCASLSTSYPDFDIADSATLYNSRKYMDNAFALYSVYTQLVDYDALKQQNDNEILKFYNGDKLTGIVCDGNVTYNDTLDPEGTVSIIIASGNITVNKEYTGVVISGGSVTAGRNINSNSNAVTAAYNGISDAVLIEGAAQKQKISYFFSNFDASSADSNVAWSISELVAVSNQKKG